MPITAELLSKAKACEHVCQEMAKEYLSFLEDDMHLKKKVQEKVQNHLDKWARKCRFASNLVDGQRYWLQLMVSAMRDLNLTGEALDCTKWRDIQKQFLGVVSPQHLCELEKTVFDGFEVHTPYERERVRGRLHKSAKDRLSEIFKIIWTDVSRGQTLLFPPKSLDLLKICAVECCAYGRVEKRSTATGLPKGVGRLIHDLSFCATILGEVVESVNSKLMPDSFPSYVSPRHIDFVRQGQYLKQFIKNLLGLKVNKFDVAQAFRRIALALWSVGDLAGEVQGHTAVELCGIFGLGSMPSIYHLFGTLLVSKKHNSLWMVLPDQLEDADWKRVNKVGVLPVMSLQDVIAGGFIGRALPCCSETFVDDTVKIMADSQACIDTCDTACADIIRSRFSHEGLSLKDIDEMKAEDVQTVIGQLMNFNTEKIKPTRARVQKGIRVINEILEGALQKKLTARQAYEVYCLWLWISIGEMRLRPFVHTLKRPLEGFCNSTDPDSRVMEDRNQSSWTEYTTCLQVLKVWGTEFLDEITEWQTSFWQMLPAYERVTAEGSEVWLQAIQKDSSMFGLGAINFTRGEYFACNLPAWSVEEMRDTFKEGFDGSEEAKEQYTIGLGELAARTLVQLLWGGTSHKSGSDLQVLEWTAGGGFPPKLKNKARAERDGWPSALWIQEDNVGMEAAGRRGHTPSATGQRQLRLEADRELLTDGMSVTTRVESKKNLSDLPSRFPKQGDDGSPEWDSAVIKEFITLVDGNELNLAEVIIPKEWIDLACSPVASRDIHEELKNGREVVMKHRPKVINWRTSRQQLLEKCNMVGRSLCNWNRSVTITASKGKFLELQESAGLGRIKKHLKVAVWFSGSLNSTRGIEQELGDGGSIVELAEITSWGVAAGQFEYPNAKQVGDLNHMVPEDEDCDVHVLQAGTPCQPYTGLGGVGGVHHESGHLYVMTVKKAIRRGFLVIMLEQVLTILVYAGGYYQKKIHQLLKAGGYSFSLRASNAFDHGVPASRFRLILVATLDAAGSHSELGKLVNMRRDSDPKCLNDIAVSHEEARSQGAAFYNPEDVQWLKNPKRIPGQSVTLGKLGTGGPGWPGGQNRTVRCAEGPTSPVSTSGNAGVYLFPDGTLRETCTTENAACQGMLTEEMRKELNSPERSVKLSDNAKIAKEAIGIGEVPHQAQSTMRAVIKFLQQCPDLPSRRSLDVKVSPLEDIDFGQTVVEGFENKLYTITELQEQERWRVKCSNQANIKPENYAAFRPTTLLGSDEGWMDNDAQEVCDDCNERVERCSCANLWGSRSSGEGAEPVSAGEGAASEVMEVEVTPASNCTQPACRDAATEVMEVNIRSATNRGHQLDLSGELEVIGSTVFDQYGGHCPVADIESLCICPNGCNEPAVLGRDMCHNCSKPWTSYKECGCSVDSTTSCCLPSPPDDEYDPPDEYDHNLFMCGECHKEMDQKWSCNECSACASCCKIGDCKKMLPPPSDDIINEEPEYTVCSSCFNDKCTSDWVCNICTECMDCCAVGECRQLMPPPTQLSLNMSTDSEGEPTISAGLIGSEPGFMPLPAAEPESMQPEVDFTKVDSNTLIKLRIKELDAKGWNVPEAQVVLENSGAITHEPRFVESLSNQCLRKGLERVASQFNRLVNTFDWTSHLAATCYITVNGAVHGKRIASGMFDPSIRRWKRKHKDRPAGLATPELKERTEFSWDEVVCNGGAIGHVLGINLAPELEELMQSVHSRKPPWSS